MNPAPYSRLAPFFSEHSKLFHYKKGEIILPPTPSPTEIFFLQEGFVKQYVILQTNDMLVTDLYHPGLIFPTIWLTTDLPNHYYFEAITPVQLFRIKKEEIKLHLDNHPDLALLITNQILSDNLERQKRTESLILNTAHLKLISFLTYLGKNFGTREGNKITIEIPLSHRDISLCVGTTRETTSLEMLHLKKAGLINYTRHTIVIMDFNKLMEEIGSRG